MKLPMAYEKLAYVKLLIINDNIFFPVIIQPGHIEK